MRGSTRNLFEDLSDQSGQGTCAESMLNSPSAWCASNQGGASAVQSSTTDYMQIDLGGIATITGLAAQGRKSGQYGQNVMAYKYSTSTDDATWSAPISAGVAGWADSQR